jgi:hypothetical protein
MDGAVRHPFGGELALGGSMARSQAEGKEGKRCERKGGNGVHYMSHPVLKAKLNALITCAPR